MVCSGAEGKGFVLGVGISISFRGEIIVDYQRVTAMSGNNYLGWWE